MGAYEAQVRRRSGGDPSSRQRNEAPLVLGVAFCGGGAHLGQALGHVVLE
jgi:hypothetical protein